MTTDRAVIAEATGERWVVATYKGHEFKLPADPDNWPLEQIRLGGNRYAYATEALLRDQWHSYLAAFPRTRDLAPATNAFAAAIGFAPRDESDLAFGALPRLLHLLARHESAVESDLNRFWNLDYLDRWRFDEDGHRRLTLRTIYVRMSNLPVDSAVAIAQNGGKTLFTRNDQLVMDVWEALTGRPHSSRPMPPEELAKRLAEAKKRDEARAATESRAAAHRSRKQMFDKARTNAQVLQGKAPAHAPEPSQEERRQENVAAARRAAVGVEPRGHRGPVRSDGQAGRPRPAGWKQRRQD